LLCCQVSCIARAWILQPEGGHPLLAWYAWHAAGLGALGKRGSTVSFKTTASLQQLANNKPQKAKAVPGTAPPTSRELLAWTMIRVDQKVGTIPFS